MPRSARLVLPGIPLHVIQRGVNRAALFIDDEDRRHYLRLLRNACRKQAVAIHAFVLMGNHVHLLITPSTVEGWAPPCGSVGRTMCSTSTSDMCGAVHCWRAGSNRAWWIPMVTC
ncbi:transposase [Stenotrophomonas rhizophila]